MNYSQAYNRIALGIGSAVLAAGCTTMQKPNHESCMGEKSTYAAIFGTSSVSYNAECGDARMAYSLLTRPGDPVGNALGFVLYIDQNKNAKAQLEERMGGKDKVRVAPETITGLLTSTDDSSRYIGAQIFAYSPEDTRVAVNDMLTARKLDPKALLSAILTTPQAASGAASTEARNRALDHAQAPLAAPAATATRTTTSCTRTRQGNQVVLDCPKQ